MPPKSWGNREGCAPSPSGGYRNGVAWQDQMSKFRVIRWDFVSNEF